MVDGSEGISAGGPHWLVKTLLTALVSVVITSILHGQNPAVQFSRIVLDKVAERAIDTALPENRAAPTQAKPKLELPTSQARRALEASASAPSVTSTNPQPQAARSSVIDDDTRPVVVTAFETLRIEEGMTYTLYAGTEYILKAPLSHSVHYTVISGKAFHKRDGQYFRDCRPYSFTTYARVSIFSLVPCSKKVIIEVDSIVAANLLADDPWANFPR